MRRAGGGLPTGEADWPATGSNLGRAGRRQSAIARAHFPAPTTGGQESGPTSTHTPGRVFCPEPTLVPRHGVVNWAVPATQGGAAGGRLRFDTTTAPSRLLHLVQLIRYGTELPSEPLGRLLQRLQDETGSSVVR